MPSGRAPNLYTSIAGDRYRDHRDRPVTLILGRVGGRDDVFTSTAGVRPPTGGHGRVRGVIRSRAAKKISAPGRPPLRAQTERQCRDAPTVRVCARTRAQSALFRKTLTVDQYDASIAVAVVVGTAVVPVCFVRCASVISRHGDRTVSRASGHVRTGAQRHDVRRENYKTNENRENVLETLRARRRPRAASSDAKVSLRCRRRFKRFVYIRLNGLKIGKTMFDQREPYAFHS